MPNHAEMQGTALAAPFERYSTHRDGSRICTSESSFVRYLNLAPCTVVVSNSPRQVRFFQLPPSGRGEHGGDVEMLSALVDKDEELRS